MTDTGHAVLLVAPAPPPYGGMAIQAGLLERLLRQDGHFAVLFASNFPLPAPLRFLERIPGLRTAVRLAMIWPRLWVQAGQAEVVHVLAASWLYFFLVVCPAVIIARARRRRVVLNYRGGAAKRFFHCYGWAIRPIFRLAHVVTAPSEFVAGAIRKTFGIAVSIVPNILEGFPYHERTTIRPRMLVNRHLEPIYAVDKVLMAFRMVQERYPEASLRIAGTGSQEAYLRGLASAWHLQDVHFLGHVPHSGLRALYDQCDILLNASEIDNFPGALIEASGAGLVVVSTGAGGIPSFYRNRHSALLVEIGDWKGLARAVQTVIEDPSLAPALTRAALETVRVCDWRKVRTRLYAAYGLGIEAATVPAGEQ